MSARARGPRVRSRRYVRDATGATPYPFIAFLNRFASANMSTFVKT